jgi:CubicO group peptidase (beta-lactamase class C family)
MPSRRGREIRLVDLATHTSGLPGSPPGLLRRALRHWSDPYTGFAAEDVLRGLGRTRLRRTPGSGRARYSNFGAALLGQALSAAANADFDALVTERICRPLGMDSTLRHVEHLAPPRRAQGHSWRGRPVPAWTVDGMPGAGGQRSTVEDMLRFASAELGEPSTANTLALSAAIRATQQPRATMARRVEVGLGWLISPLADDGPTLYWHNGGTGGFRSMLGVVPDRGLAVVVLCNTARGVERLAFSILRACTRLAEEEALPT